MIWGCVRRNISSYILCHHLLAPLLPIALKGRWQLRLLIQSNFAPVLPGSLITKLSQNAPSLPPCREWRRPYPLDATASLWEPKAARSFILATARNMKPFGCFFLLTVDE
jgi:hypothetical protein